MSAAKQLTLTVNKFLTLMLVLLKIQEPIPQLILLSSQTAVNQQLVSGCISRIKTKLHIIKVAQNLGLSKV